jgi:ATP-dependent DNA helicase RecQ
LAGDFSNGETMADINAALQAYFGFSSFRPGQAESLQTLLSGHHTLTVMPTGSGKSLIFQLAGLLLSADSNPPPVTLVISPLIALMKDQVNSLVRRDISATYINSALPAAEQSNRLQQLAGGKYQLVYIAPERLRNSSFLHALSHRRICLLAVDEAHCISEWGHDFRPDYLNIAHARSGFGNPLTVALTATATPKVQNDILHLLGLEETAARIVTGFNRTNLALNVRYTSGLPGKLKALKELIDPQQEGAVIIYTGTRRDAEEVVEFVRQVIRVPARFYHAGLAAGERTSVQEAFISGKLNLVVATNAFGMGIDRADVRQVIHFSLPGSIEAYYQECGRAGRDGLPASATLLYDPQDRALQEFFVQQSELATNDLNAVFRSLPASKEIWVSIEELSLRSDLHPVQIKVGLSVLERAGALEHLGDEGMRMMYRRGSWIPDKIEAAMLHGKQHAQNRQQELDSIVHYAESNNCRRQIILRHFGDRDTSQVADCCDNCRSTQTVLNPGDVAQMNHGERAALIILDCIHRMKVNVGREKLSQILHGSKAKDILKFHYDKNTYYSRLAAVKMADIDSLIVQLIDLGYIKGIGGEYPVLVLSPRGENALKQKEQIDLYLPESFEPSHLRRARAKLAAGGTIGYTAKLFMEGLKPEQIALERQLALTTIYKHLARLISAGTLKVEQVVPDELRERIDEAIQKVGSDQYLAPIRALLPDSIDFNLIRCVVAGRRQQKSTISQEQKETTSEIEMFLAKPHPRMLTGLWQTGWSLGFHSRFSGSDWSRSPIGDLTHRLKYNSDLSALPALVEQTLSLINSHPELRNVECIVPVPSTTERQINPVQVFCEVLAAKLDLPVKTLVRKTRLTRPQKEMKTLAQKRANIAGAFALTGDVRHKRILLVDDLYDSGATLEEITRLFLQHGAEYVNVFTLTCTIHADL